MSDQEKDTRPRWATSSDGLTCTRIGAPWERHHLVFTVKGDPDRTELTWLAISGPQNGADVIDRRECHELARLLRFYAEQGRFPTPPEREAIESPDPGASTPDQSLDQIYATATLLVTELTELALAGAAYIQIAAAIQHLGQAMRHVATARKELLG